MARALAPTTAMLRELRELKAPRNAAPQRQELVATGVMIVPTGSAEDWERIAKASQQALIARCAEDRRE
ncbi:MAG: hypothetical protein ABL916_07520 [Burkholderiaceae bacterium]